MSRVYVWAFAVTLGGCAGSKPGAAQSPPPSAATAEAAAPRPAQPGAPSGYPSGTGSMPGPADAARTRALLEWEQAWVELEAPWRECRLACRALLSLERATSHICELGQPKAPPCEDARARLGQAKERVKSQCQACPGGPDLDN